MPSCSASRCTQKHLPPHQRLCPPITQEIGVQFPDRVASCPNKCDLFLSDWTHLFLSRTISFGHDGSMCRRAPPDVPTDVIKDRSDLILPASVSFGPPPLQHGPNACRATAAYDSFRQHWLCNGLAAIFGNDFGLLLSQNARSVLTATKIMIRSNHLGASLITVEVENAVRVISIAPITIPSYVVGPKCAAHH